MSPADEVNATPNVNVMSRNDVPTIT